MTAATLGQVKRGNRKSVTSHSARSGTLAICFPQAIQQSATHCATAAVATGGASQPFFALAVIPASVLTRRTCFFSLGVYTRLDWIGMFSPICIAPPVYHVPQESCSREVLNKLRGVTDVSTVF